MGDGFVEVSAAGERILLMPQRTAFWASRSTLLLADLHLGKGETLAAAGVPMPPGVTGHDLARLGDALRLTGARRVLILGDLLHAGIGIVPALVEQFGQWRAGFDAEFTLVPGNHDRHVQRVAAQWTIDVAPPVVHEGPFTFVHDAAHSHGGASYVWSGHVHPLCRLAAGGDSLTFPCFLVDEQETILPAFSRFTAGVCVGVPATARAFGVADGRVMDLTPPPRAARRKNPCRT
jgi:DNA ligase-associated metallophosphoesterase